MRAPREVRAGAAVGLAGVLLAGVGDLLILGRPVSGRDVDRARGLVPPSLAEDRWRSLWNGVEHPEARVRLGTVGGLVGIGLVSGWGLGGAVRALQPGCPAARRRRLRRGVRRRRRTHPPRLRRRGAEPPGDACRGGAGRRATRARAAGPPAERQRRVDAGRPRRPQPRPHRGGTPAGQDWRRQAAVTPFPWVLAALATTGRLPGPVGGYLRPASVNGGLLLSLALARADRG